MSRKSRAAAAPALLLVLLLQACAEPDPGPAPAPPSSSDPPRGPTLPVPGQQANDGEVVSGGGSDAAARMEKQFPPASTTAYSVGGDQALTYFNELAGIFPGLSRVTAFTEGAQCLLATGALGARVYVDKQLTSAAGLLIYTTPAIGDVVSTVATCLLERVVSGGGASFDPCADRFRFTNTTDGVQATYYAFAVGTQPAECQSIRAFYERFRPTDF